MTNDKKKTIKKKNINTQHTAAARDFYTSRTQTFTHKLRELFPVPTH